VLGAQAPSGVNVTTVFPLDTPTVPATLKEPFAGLYCCAYTVPLFTVCGLIGLLNVNTTGVVSDVIVDP
jgi:hypothetical protein